MRYLTISEAAEGLQLSIPTVKRYIYEGKLKSTKLPGGQHRIPESEIERLLGAAHTPEGAEPSEDEHEQRIVVLERWVTELEAEIERLNATLAVVARYCAGKCQPQRPYPVEPFAAPAISTVLVLGPGCKRCDTLYNLTQRVLRQLGRSEVQVRRVEAIDEIADFGPVLTPALVCADEVIVSGRVPTELSLRKLLQGCLA